jgi:hypothetical protein
LRPRQLAKSALEAKIRERYSHSDNETRVPKKKRDKGTARELTSAHAITRLVTLELQRR